MEIMKNLKT